MFDRYPVQYHGVWDLDKRRDTKDLPTVSFVAENFMAQERTRLSYVIWGGIYNPNPQAAGPNAPTQAKVHFHRAGILLIVGLILILLSPFTYYPSPIGSIQFEFAAKALDEGGKPKYGRLLAANLVAPFDKLGVPIQGDWALPKSSSTRGDLTITTVVLVVWLALFGLLVAARRLLANRDQARRITW